MVTAQDGELGRTISYNVSSFTDVRDKTMEDIMEFTPNYIISGYRENPHTEDENSLSLNGS
ncbi:MAG: hypothetical protein J6K90_06335 [Tidjanibacter sp.]|nr:hypothetical protein [Tidjanibacter sp.]